MPAKTKDTAFSWGTAMSLSLLATAALCHCTVVCKRNNQKRRQYHGSTIKQCNRHDLTSKHMMSKCWIRTLKIISQKQCSPRCCGYCLQSMKLKSRNHRYIVLFWNKVSQKRQEWSRSLLPYFDSISLAPATPKHSLWMHYAAQVILTLFPL